MDQFVCFTHVTRLENFASILKQGRLMTIVEKCKTNTHGTGVFSGESDCSHIFTTSDQFPGLYLNALHKKTQVKAAGSDKPSSTVELVFPVDLLCQENWHLNIIDQNGCINQNTYCRASLEGIPDMQTVEAYYEGHGGYYPGNELVMHDGIPTALMAEVWVPNASTKRNLVDALRGQGVTCPVPIKVRRLPPKPLRALTSQLRHLDLLSRPVMSYFLDSNYTGIPVPKYLTRRNKTPITIQRKIAMNAGVKQAHANRMDLKQLNGAIGKKLQGVFSDRPIVKWNPPLFGLRKSV